MEDEFLSPPIKNLEIIAEFLQKLEDYNEKAVIQSSCFW